MKHNMKVSGLVAGAGLALGAAAVAQTTCDLVDTRTNIELTRSLQPDYISAQTEYWSTECGSLKPSCILLPQSTEEVATIVSLLHENNETFAIKSGGHNPNNYWASIDGGPLISTKNMNEILLDQDAETLRVGPGNRWDDLSAQLDGTGYSAVGGRIGNVGVGGYMLGGGLSFMSTEYGWAANSVLEYTLVLANASVVKVTPTSDPDLYKSLTAGGNNFGIVTSYLLKVYQQPAEIWGGNLIFDATDDITDSLTAAIRNFTLDYPDPKAGIILTAERTLATLADLWIVFLYYNGPQPPTHVFQDFLSLTPKINTCKTQSYNALLSGNNWAVVQGSVYTIGTETIPVPQDPVKGPQIMRAFYDAWVSVSDTVKFVPGLIASVAFQPLPKEIARAAKNSPGKTDLVDLDPEEEGAKIVLEFDYSFLFQTDDAEVYDTMQATYEKMAELRDNFTASGDLEGGEDAYMPLFMNDAFHRQDYFSRLRPENWEMVKEVQGRVDPDGFWKGRTGGMKIVK